MRKSKRDINSEGTPRMLTEALAIGGDKAKRAFEAMDAAKRALSWNRTLTASNQKRPGAEKLLITV